MKRKTNLFYTTGPDSKFLTFSNYTESLTGNFISTDHKLFPSKFLCMNVENLTEATKPSFVQLLSAYYENKLAVLRDDCINKGHNCEDYVLPLAYLVECLMHIEFDSESNTFVWNDKELTDADIAAKEDMFNYVGDISEEDYDGTYSDVICMIDLSTIKTASPYVSESKRTNDVANVSTSEIIEDPDSLYGWTHSTDETTGDIIDTYNEVKPIFDVAQEDESYYNYTTVLSSLTLKEKTNRCYTATEAAYYNSRLQGAVREGDIKNENDVITTTDGKRENFVDFLVYNKESSVYETYTKKEAIEHNASLPGAVDTNTINNCPMLIFNVIIPLYDLVNINYKSNDSILISNTDSIELERTSSNVAYNHNVPLGMWISTIPVELETDRDTLMSPTWSLLVSSQFKALPYYSKNIYEAGIENQKILESSNTKMYNTFASVLVRQNQIIDMFTKMQSQLIDMQKRIELLQNQVSNIGTNKNIDSLHIEQTNFELDMNKKMNEFKAEVQEYFKNMTWKATI